jgi:pyruvate formate lyase activating enzyme
MQTAYISNIQHFNVHDGNGFRTTVFFQGCGLKCKWCQNPELQNMEPVMMYNASLCTGCNACVEACKNQALSRSNDKIVFHEKECNQCLQCEDECYYLSRTFSSHKMSVEAVYREVIKDKPFYMDGGGITLSGGEPLIYDEFCMSLIKRLQDDNISVIIETAGFVIWNVFIKLAPYVDIFFYDLKLIDAEKRMEWLGTNNDCMLENLQKLAKIHSRIVIRIPLIPGVNDTEAEFESMIQFVDDLHTIKYIHILPFHQLGAEKYNIIGMPYEMKNVQEYNEGRIHACTVIAKQHGYHVDIGGTAFAFR